MPGQAAQAPRQPAGGPHLERPHRQLQLVVGLPQRRRLAAAVRQLPLCHAQALPQARLCPSQAVQRQRVLGSRRLAGLCLPRQGHLHAALLLQGILHLVLGCNTRREGEERSEAHR